MNLAIAATTGTVRPPRATLAKPNRAKREFQVNIGTRDPFKPNYSLKVLFPWRSPQMASEIRQLLSADHYQ